MSSKTIGVEFTQPKMYSDASRLQQMKAKKAMVKYNDWFNWTKGDKVLDIGCGPGIITTDLILQCIPCREVKVVGVDLSGSMVEHATKSYPDPRLSFYQMDITETDINIFSNSIPSDVLGEGFDKIFCFYLLHWLGERMQQGLCNISALLKPGGKGLSLQYVSIPVFDLYVEIGESAKWAPYLKEINKEFNPLRIAEDPKQLMTDMVNEAGMEVDDIDIYHSHNVYNQGIPELIALMTSIDPFLKYLPRTVHKEYMHDFITRLVLKCNRSPEGYICIPFSFMTCTFSKPEIS